MVSCWECCFLPLWNPNDVPPSKKDRIPHVIDLCGRCLAFVTWIIFKFSVQYQTKISFLLPMPHLYLCNYTKNNLGRLLFHLCIFIHLCMHLLCQSLSLLFACLIIKTLWNFYPIPRPSSFLISVDLIDLCLYIE